jgi:hypothetical protein
MCLQLLDARSCRSGACGPVKSESLPEPSGHAGGSHHVCNSRRQHTHTTETMNVMVRKLHCDSSMGRQPPLRLVQTTRCFSL